MFVSAYTNHGMEDETLLLSDRESDVEELRNGELPTDTRTITPRPRHGHCHDTVPADSCSLRRSRRKLAVAVCLVFVFMFAELIGGILSNSLAVATDAAHLLTDFMGFSINLVSLEVATRKPTRVLNFGWYRIEVLGALLSVLLLWTVTGILVYMAVLRLLHPDYLINPTIMVVMATLGVLFNIIQSLNLVGVPGHGHSHGSVPEPQPVEKSQGSRKVPDPPHDNVYERLSSSLPHDNPSYGALGGHGYDVVDDITSDVENDVSGIEMTIVSAADEGEFMERVLSGELDAGKPQAQAHRESINVRAALIHVLGDLVQSVGVLIAAVILYFRPDWKWADPVCTFTFSLVVLLTTAPIVKEILVTLVEAVPPGVAHGRVEEQLAGIPGVRGVHDLHIWALTSHKTCATAHLVIDGSPCVDPCVVVSQADVLLKGRFRIDHVTVQVEIYSDLMEACPSCQPTYVDDLTNKS